MTLSAMRMCVHVCVTHFASLCLTWLMLLMFVRSDINNAAYHSDFDNFNFLDDDLIGATTTATTTGTTFDTYSHPKWLEPYFDPATPRNITALMGKSAYLSCRVRNLGNKTVSWIRHRDIHILTVGSYTYTSDQRFQATHHTDSDDWTLQIKWAQKRDAGMYECQISTQPVRSYFVRLNVVVPTATILGGPDLHVDKGSTINLTCTVKFSPEPPAYIFWYHHEEVINYDSSRGGVSVITEKGDVTTSFLLIQNADLVDSGKYSCAPSNADVASVRVHVLNGEHPEAMQTGSSGCQFNWVTIILLMSFVYYYYQQNVSSLTDDINKLNALNANGNRRRRRRKCRRLTNDSITDSASGSDRAGASTRESPSICTASVTTTIIKATRQSFTNENNNNNNNNVNHNDDNKIISHNQVAQQQQQQQATIKTTVKPNTIVNVININQNCCCQPNHHYDQQQQFEQLEKYAKYEKLQRQQQKQQQPPQQAHQSHQYYQYREFEASNNSVVDCYENHEQMNHDANNSQQQYDQQQFRQQQQQKQHYEQQQQEQHYKCTSYVLQQRQMSVASSQLVTYSECHSKLYCCHHACLYSFTNCCCCCCCYCCYCCYYSWRSWSSCARLCSFLCHCSCSYCHFQFYNNHYQRSCGCYHFNCWWVTSLNWLKEQPQQQLQRRQQLHHITLPAQSFMPKGNNEQFLAVR